MMTAVTWNPGKPGSNLAGYVLAEMDLPGIGVRKVLALERGNDGSWHCTSAVGYVGVAQALEPSYLPSVCRDGAMLAKAGAPGSAPVSAPAATACAADQEQITTQDSSGKSHQVCAKRCATGQKRDPVNLASCIADKPALAPLASSPQQAPAVPIPAPCVTCKDLAIPPPEPPFDITGIPDDKTCPPGKVFLPARQTAPNWDVKPDASSVPDAAQIQIPTDPTTPYSGSCVDTGNDGYYGQSEPYKTNKCQVCRGTARICEQLHTETDCAWPNNFCANVLNNADDASRTVNRFCASADYVRNVWYMQYSDDDKCTQFKEGLVYTQEFNCSYGCVGENCNEKINPDNGGWTP